jgi:dephospho-CoA kinase
MRKLICIGGEPACGKTTIMKRFLENKQLQEKQPKKLVSSMYDDEHKLYILGKYGNDELFQGTDKLSMAVQPNAVEFLKECKENILFEGDRLFTQSFLEVAVELVDQSELDLKIILINTDPKIIEKRHIDRGDTQTEKFLKSRVTKYENIRASFILMPYILEMKNNNETDLNIIVDFLRLELHNAT